MTGDYLVLIQRSIDYIEEHLAEELPLAVLAKKAGFSEYHYHRIFQTMVGDTAADYIRKRRLVRAAYRVAQSDDRLLDIALDHGFQSHETFLRAFRRLFGCTPWEYRKHGGRTPIYLKADLLQSRFNPYLGGIRMEYRIVKKPEFKVIGYELRTSNHDGRNYREIPAFWQTYLTERLYERIPNRVHTESGVELGICTDFDMETGEFSYIIGMEVNGFDGVPEGMACRSFPVAEYAVFTTPQFSSSIQNTWKAIFGEWFPQSGYQHAGTAEFELYDERCRGDLNELVQMDIYIPVKPVERE
jgi:AraC family transcriptional regulator